MHAFKIAAILAVGLASLVAAGMSNFLLSSRSTGHQYPRLFEAPSGFGSNLFLIAVENEPRWASECVESTSTVTVTVVPTWCSAAIHSNPILPTTPPAGVPSSGSPSSASIVVPPLVPITVPGSASIPAGETPQSSVTVTEPAPTPSAPAMSTSVPSASAPSVTTPAHTTANHSTSSTGSAHVPGTSTQPDVPTVSSNGAAVPTMASDYLMARLLLAGAVINGAFAALA
ncbi:hypothetical protein BU16DRAFT_244075 [Lophium mytilinum]|uniref:Uncharacterized protein n=1 Tax=Lophium mytilinum TaxID=390894 RepID=A0A6A6R943_9PEZI|nr:hypothetical protein BU16DRAFT_244075 [Lophium mytilinum]